MSNVQRTVNTERGLILDYSPITVDGILTPADAAENGVTTNKFRAQLRQVVTTRYPKARGNALFAATEFGPTQDFQEKRVTWVNVPEGTTIEEVQARLDALPSPTLVKILGLKPLLSQSQIEAMERGINTKTWEQYLENYVKTEDGQAAKFQNRLQYRAIYLSENHVDDDDNRIADLKELQAAELQMARDTEHNSPVQMATGEVPVITSVEQHQQ